MNGGLNDWALDLRHALSKSRFLKPITKEFCKVLKREKANQIVGKGFGSFYLMGAILAQGKGLRGGLIRESSKPYGFRQVVEGDLQSKGPTYIIDDIVATGSSVRSALKILKKSNIKPAGVISVFNFGWKPKVRFPKGFKIITLATLNYKT